MGAPERSAPFFVAARAGFSAGLFPCPGRPGIRLRGNGDPDGGHRGDETDALRSAGVAGRGDEIAGRRRRRGEGAGRRDRPADPDARRSGRARGSRRHQEHRRNARNFRGGRAFPARRRGDGHGDHGARGIQRRMAGHRRRREADRLDPDTRPGDAGRKSVQRLARRRQRAGADRRRCGRLGDRPRAGGARSRWRTSLPVRARPR